MSRAIDDIKDEEINDELSGLSGGANSPSDILEKKVTLFQQLHENIREELEGNYWEITNYNPLQFIIAHSGHNQVIHATVGRKKEAIQDKQDFDTDGYKSVPSLKLQNIIIGAIPTEITYHENPLGFIEDTYTIKFSSHTGKTFTIGPKTLEEIISVLQSEGISVCV